MANRYKIVDFAIRDGKKHPVAIICPGGGYSMVCSYVEGVPFARKLNAMGISAFVVYYRCRSRARLPNPQDDLARAVRHIASRADELNLDMSNYSVWGSSAGGHLVSTFGTEHLGYAYYGLPKPGALVLVYPVITMEPYTHGGTRNNLLGPSPSRDAIVRASTEQNVTASYPPTFIWCGSADSVVSPDNSRNMASALEKAGVRYEFVEYPGIDHGVGLGEGTVCEEWVSRAVHFWLP